MRRDAHRAPIRRAESPQAIAVSGQPTATPSISVPSPHPLRRAMGPVLEHRHGASSDRQPSLNTGPTRLAKTPFRPRMSPKGWEDPPNSLSAFRRARAAGRRPGIRSRSERVPPGRPRNHAPRDRELEPARTRTVAMSAEHQACVVRQQVSTRTAATVAVRPLAVCTAHPDDAHLTPSRLRVAPPGAAWSVAFSRSAAPSTALWVPRNTVVSRDTRP